MAGTRQDAVAQVSAADLLQYLADALYLAIFLVAVAHAARTRLRADLDVALFFGATAIIVASSLAPGAAGTAAIQLIATISATLLMALPYLLLRLVYDFTEVPVAVMWLALGGLALAIVALVVVPQPYPLALVGLLVLYFVALEAFDAVAFGRAARRSRGVTRRRMQAVALGTLFVGLDILAAGLGAALPGAGAVWTLASAVLGFASGIAYLVGFAPPGWLRRAWQAPDLRRVLGQSAALIWLPDQETVLDELARACAEAVGAPQAVIDLWDEATNTLSFRFDGRGYRYPADQLLAGRVLLSQRPLFMTNLAADHPGLAAEHQTYPVRAALLAPITVGERRFGVVVVSSPRAPIFAEDDLALVQLLADQLAVVLESRALIEETARERARAESLALAEAERRRINAELEARVAQRTAELQQALHELEAFSYSVSHDLRAPLRTIDGFVQAFLEDYGGQLDEVGQDYLNRTRAASQRMSQLIDGLLRLSRVTRSEMVRERVNLSSLARGIVTDLERAQPERHVEFTIQDGLIVEGDEQLLRVALENLLGNAWKFTSKHPSPRIEFSAVEWDGETVYQVRDNGAGFDPAYSDKLFGPFQRLHGRDEFEGTGIGLATVQRIVRRHGGRIWGESTVDQGATFSFTLAPGPVSLAGGTGGDVGGRRVEQTGDLVS
jgi:signal transduction histidine kinase